MSNGLKKFFVLFFHILVTSAFGSTLLESELSKPISTLIEINSGALHSGLNSLCTQELFYKKENKKQSSSELYNKCAIDLCGPPEFNPTAWLTNANFSQNVSAFALKRTEKMIPLMDKMFNISLKRQKHLLIKMKALVAGPEKLLNAASSTENENMGSHFFPQFVKTTVNKSASLLERINISVSLPKDASIELALAVKNYADNLKLSMMNNASYTEFQQAYGEDDYSQLLAYHFKNLKNSLPKNTHAELIELDKLISEKKNFNRSEFFITLNKLKLLSQKYPLESKEVFKNSVCDIPECKMALVEFLTSSKTKDTIKLYEDQLNDPEVKNRAINQCRALIISESMRETDAKKAQLVFKAAVSNIKSSLLPTFSSHSRELLTAYLNKSLSASHKNYNNNNNRNPFVEFEESAKDFINFDKKVISFGNNNLPIEKILELHQDDSSSDLFNDVQPCQKMASNAWDSFLPAETMKKVFSPDESKKAKLYGNGDIIFVSDFSCEHHDHGLFNVSHEIGHALNSVFANQELSRESKARYDSIRACTTSIYPKNPLSLLAYSQENDKISSEEDLADQIAIFSNPKSKTLASCALLKPSPQNNSYQELLFIDESFEDVHSTSFSRVLIEAHSRNISFPQSCKELIKIEKPNLEFKKCL